jgi:hypothetical protein
MNRDVISVCRCKDPHFLMGPEPGTRVCTKCNGYNDENWDLYAQGKVPVDTPPKVKDPKPETCKCKTTTYRNGICDRCGGEYDWDRHPSLSSPLPRKEVISIQPGDVISIAVDDPRETHSFCVSDRDNTYITIPAGSCTLEVYREQAESRDVCGVCGGRPCACGREQVERD